MHICTYTCLHFSMHLYIYIYIHKIRYAQTSIQYVHMYVYIYIHTCTHTKGLTCDSPSSFSFMSLQGNETSTSLRAALSQVQSYSLLSPLCNSMTVCNSSFLAMGIVLHEEEVWLFNVFLHTCQERTQTKRTTSELLRNALPSCRRQWNTL